MRALCIANNITELNDPLLRERLMRSIHIDGAIPDLTIGAEYQIEAVEVWDDGSLQFYIHIVPQVQYPYPFPAELFEVVSNDIPSGWSIGFGDRGANKQFRRVTFEEWASDDKFYEKLVDGDPGAVSLYLKRRRHATSTPKPAD